MMPRNQDREAAIADCRKKYMGKPCRHGHSGLRYVSRWACVECVAERKEKALIGGKPE